MADAVTNFAAIQNDAVSYWIASEMYNLVERRLVIGQFAKQLSLPQRLGKTLRVDRYQRFNLPLTTLTEGTPPDAVALAIDKVDIVVEQWGIVALLTDVADITTAHPALQIAIDRCSQAMEQMLEREMSLVLLAGTNVFYGGSATSRAGLGASDKLTTAVVLKSTSFLRSGGAQAFEGNLYAGCMPPQMEADILGSDSTFQAASNYAGLRKLEEAEIGVWMGVRWVRGNFLPIFKGQSTPDASAASGALSTGDAKPKVLAIDGGGTITSATNFKFAVVWRDKTTDMERHITQTSANIASTATGNNESFTIDVPSGTLTNYYYDVYMTAAGGSGSLFKVLSRQTTATSAVIATMPAGTEATLTAAPAATREVFTAFIFGQDAFTRVQLNGMSMASYLTPPGASWANPLAQGRKCGAKIMWKSAILDNAFFCRIEAASGFSANLPTG